MEALASAVNLSIFGMGFVFSFLVLLVFIMKLLSKIANSTINITSNPEFGSAPTTATQNTTAVQIDKKTKHIITEAIKMHRGG